jgi:hypothetical protein
MKKSTEVKQEIVNPLWDNIFRAAKDQQAREEYQAREAEVLAEACRRMSIIQGKSSTKQNRPVKGSMRQTALIDQMLLSGRYTMPDMVKELRASLADKARDEKVTKNRINNHIRAWNGGVNGKEYRQGKVVYIRL